MSNDALDPKNYVSGKAPEGGSDGYSDFASDFASDYDPALKKRTEEYAKQLMQDAPDYIKQAEQKDT